MRQWKKLVMVLAVALVGLSVVAVAYAQTNQRDTKQTRGACRAALTEDPAALKAMQELREEHQKEMLAWRDKYGADPSTAEAREAFSQLREEHWNDMRALLEKYGVDVPDAQGPGMGRGVGGCGGGGGCQGAGFGQGASAGQGAGYGQGAGMMGGGMMGGTY